MISTYTHYECSIPSLSHVLGILTVGIVTHTQLAQQEADLRLEDEVCVCVCVYIYICVCVCVYVCVCVCVRGIILSFILCMICLRDISVVYCS